MPEDLDPTTARLAAELASNILPSLTKSLMAAIPSTDFAGVFERSSKAAQDLRSQVEKIIRSDIEENRTARSVLLQSLSSILDEMSALKRTVDKLPASLGKAKPEPQSTNNQEIMTKLEEITAQLEEIIHGIKSFGEAYASDREQQTPVVSQHIYSGSDAQLEKLITTSLPSLEGLLRANAKSQSKELEDFSREISTLHEQNNTALIHEVKEGVVSELSQLSDDILAKINAEHEEKFMRMNKILRLLMIMSGASITLTLITIIMMIVK